LQLNREAVELWSMVMMNAKYNQRSIDDDVSVFPSVECRTWSYSFRWFYDFYFEFSKTKISFFFVLKSKSIFKHKNIIIIF
jgi:hypothetical protein